MNRPRLRASANSELKGVGTRMENRAIGQPNPINVIGRDVAASDSAPAFRLA